MIAIVGLARLNGSNDLLDIYPLLVGLSAGVVVTVVVLVVGIYWMMRMAT